MARHYYKVSLILDKACPAWAVYVYVYIIYISAVVFLGDLIGDYMDGRPPSGDP